MKEGRQYNLILKSLSLEMPYFQDHVVAGRRDNSIFSIELHTGDEVFMSFYLFLLFAKVQVPNPNSLIV